MHQSRTRKWVVDFLPTYVKMKQSVLKRIAITAGFSVFDVIASTEQ